jgi:prophage regulatory protein
MPNEAIARNTDATRTNLLRQPKVLERVPWSPTTLWRKVRAGDFPPPIRLGKNSIAWRESDVEKWIAEREHA